MQKARLLKLASFLRNKVDNKHFDLSIVAEKRSCGTVCCAVGFCPSVFPRSGWSIDKYSSSSNYLSVDYTNSRGSYSDLDGASEFFGINHDQTAYLFIPEYYPKDHRGRISVAKRIEKFVDDNGVIPANPKEYNY